MVILCSFSRSSTHFRGDDDIAEDLEEIEKVLSEHVDEMSNFDRFTLPTSLSPLLSATSLKSCLGSWSGHHLTEVRDSGTVPQLFVAAGLQVCLMSRSQNFLRFEEDNFQCLSILKGTLVTCPPALIA